MTSLGKNEREEHCSDRQTLIFNSLGFRKLKYFTYPLSRATKLKLEDPGCSIFAAFKNVLGAKRYYLITPILKEHDNQFYILGKLLKNVRMEWPQVKQRIGFSESEEHEFFRNVYCANNSLAFDIEANLKKADITLTGVSSK